MDLIEEHPEHPTIERVDLIEFTNCSDQLGESSQHSTMEDEDSTNQLQNDVSFTDPFTGSENQSIGEGE